MFYSSIQGKGYNAMTKLSFTKVFFTWLGYVNPLILKQGGAPNWVNGNFFKISRAYAG